MELQTKQYYHNKIKRKIDYKQLLIETAMRAQIMLPQSEEQDKWFESGTDAKTEDGKNFFLRLQKALSS